MGRDHRRNLTFLPKGLTLRDDQFEGLHQRVDKTRSTSNTIVVNRQALMRLLNDYGLLLAGYDDVERALRGGEALGKEIKEKARNRNPKENDGGAIEDGSDLI